MATTQQLPEQFGRFRIIRPLGQGGMGSVYLAEDTALGRNVALKVAHLDASDNQETIERFRREARAAAQLEHPYLCPVHEVGVLDGIHFIVMAYVEGQSLAALIEKDGGLPPRQVAALVGKLAVALNEAHERGVFHRDLKPSNIMIKPKSRGKEPVIVDFGLARQRDATDKLTKTGQVMGTPHYMAPEQIRGVSEDIGASCDIFALGVILYELLTGQLPFDGPTNLAVVAQILTQPPQPPTAHRPDLDPALEGICLKALAKQPKDRYASMADMAADLSGFLHAAATAPANTALDRAVSTLSAAPGTTAPRQTGSDTLMAELLNRVGPDAASAPTVESGSHQNVLVVALNERLQSLRQRAAAAGAALRARVVRFLQKAAVFSLGLALLAGLGYYGMTKLTNRDGAGDGKIASEHSNRRAVDKSSQKRVNAPPPDPLSVVARTDHAVRQPRETKAKSTPFPRPSFDKPTPSEKLESPRVTSASVPFDVWIPLFNGKDLSGFQQTIADSDLLRGREEFRDESGSWTVKAGTLTGQGNMGNGKMLYLSPRAMDLEDFQLHVEASISSGGRARLVVRNALRIDQGRGAFWTGYAVGVSGHENAKRTGTLFNFVSQRGDRVLVDAIDEQVTPGKLFTLDLIALDNHFKVSVNGKRVVDWTDPNGLYTDAGRISVVLDGKAKVEFFKIEVMRLDPNSPRSIELAAAAGATAPAPKADTPIVAKETLKQPDEKPPAMKPPDAVVAASSDDKQPALVDEDFQKVAVGGLPAGWTANVGNVAVVAVAAKRNTTQQNKRSRGAAGSGLGADTGPRQPSDHLVLAIKDPARPDYVTLPELEQELSGDFVIDCDFIVPAGNEGIGIGLAGRQSEHLELRVFGNGAVTAKTTARPHVLRHNGPLGHEPTSRVRLERRGNDYVVTLDGVQLDPVPLNIGKIKFKTIQLLLGPMAPPPAQGRPVTTRVPAKPGSRATKSPQIHHLRVELIGP